MPKKISTIITDKGSQLMAAQKEVSPNWDIIQEKMSNIKWTFAPAAAHHWNGMAESIVKRTKKNSTKYIAKLSQQDDIWRITDFL